MRTSLGRSHLLRRSPSSCNDPRARRDSINAAKFDERVSGVATPRELWVGLTHDSAHGPLAGILSILTVIAGLVDATSLLRLDRVFVANVTGSVIFIGLALVGARGFSLAAPLTALASFLIGGGIGVRVFARHVTHRGRSAYAACLAQFTDLLVASVIVLFDHHPTDPVRLTLVGILALGMGAKSALVRSVNVPGLTTAVVTTTLTGLASEGATGSWRSTAFAVRSPPVLCWWAPSSAGRWWSSSNVGLASPRLTSWPSGPCSGHAQQPDLMRVGPSPRASRAVSLLQSKGSFWAGVVTRNLT